MQKQKIKWSRKYCIDEGDGYTYYYFIYEFFLPAGDLIKFRQYKNEDFCILYLAYNELAKMKDFESKEKINCIHAVLHYITKEFGVKKFNYYSNAGNYIPLNTDNLNKGSDYINFEQLK